MQRIAIFGAYSAIAEATARRLAAAGGAFFLVGRNAETLERVAADLRVRGASDVAVFAGDLADADGCRAAVDALFAQFDAVDVALIAHGTLPEQAACEGDLGQTMAALQVNALSPIALLSLLAEKFAQQGEGTLAVITSVAGERGRKSNYVYGAAKGAVSTFVEGLQHRFAGSKVRVIDIRPGFVDTPMTDRFPKGPLWASPDKVAGDIVRAIERGRRRVYTPWFWRFVMLIIRNVPAFLLHKTNL